MDAKITKTRLKTMLSYDWLKIVGAIAAAIFVWVMAFTMTATKIIPSQHVVVCSYLGNATLDDLIYTDLSKQLNERKLTHETLEGEILDLSTAKDAAYSLLQARVYVDDLDVMLVSKEWDTSTSYQAEDGETVLYERTYLQSFLYGYYNRLHYLGDKEDGSGYFQQLKAYLNQYYTNGYLDDSVLDTDKIEADFRARAKGDKRYKTEAEIQKGVQGDIERVKKYRAALISFDAYVAQGTIGLETSSLSDRFGEEIFKDGKGVYSINIAKTEEAQTKISKYVSYITTYEDENGKTQKKLSAKDMQVCLFNTNEQNAHRFEGLVYLINFLDAALA